MFLVILLALPNPEIDPPNPKGLIIPRLGTTDRSRCLLKSITAVFTGVTERIFITSRTFFFLPMGTAV